MHQQQVRQFQEGQSVVFVSWFEEQIQKAGEKAGEQGEIKGLHQGIAMGLELKFGADGQALALEVEKQTDLKWLRRFFDAIRSANTLDDLRKLLP